MSWNFVSSRASGSVAAEDDWQAQRFAPVPGETEFIPLPERATPERDERTRAGRSMSTLPATASAGAERR